MRSDIDTNSLTLVEAVEILDRTVAEWERSGDEEYTEAIIDVFNSVCAHCLSGFPPDDQMELFVSVLDFAKEWNDVYQNNAVDDAGKALDAFKESLARLRSSVRSARITEIPRIEPVSELMEQMKDDPGKYRQIARMYGDRDRDTGRYSGIFFDRYGNPDHDLIRKESENPGSVVPDDFIPPGRKRRQEMDRERSQDRLSELRRELEQRKTRSKPDPASVESLLREGQFPDVIARIKGIPEDHVREVAESFGITIQEREDILEHSAENPVHEARLESEKSTQRLTGEKLRDFMLDLYGEDSDVTEHDALIKIGEQGLSASASAVKKILRDIKKAVEE
jgi:hypothetical protein